MGADAVLDLLDRYLDSVPRSAARVEQFRSITLFARRGSGWAYYARPTRGWPAAVDPADVAAVGRRQRELAEPESFEWVAEVTPALRPILDAAGLRIEALPLMVLRQPRAAVPPPGVRIRMLAADDPQLTPAMAVAQVGFGVAGTSVGAAGIADRDAAATATDPARLDFVRERMRSRLTATAIAEQDGLGPVCVGSHQPLDGVTEIVGVATLPVARRQGLAAAVTALLVADAAGCGVETVFLSAGSEDVARMYGGIGFERVGTSCIAEPGP